MAPSGMAPSGFRIALLVLGCAFVFALTAGVLAAVMPVRKPSDWVAIGTVATLLSMLTAYFALVLTSPERKAEMMPRRRQRAERIVARGAGPNPD